MNRLYIITCMLLPTLWTASNARADSATFALGQRLVSTAPQGGSMAYVYRPSPSSFQIGEALNASDLSQITDHVRAERTIGKVNPDTVRKAGGDFQKYLQMRGKKSVAGKVFEETMTRKYNRSGVARASGTKLESTAALGRPHDPADLVLYDAKTNRVLQRYQLKSSSKAAIDALSDPKYADCVIVTHSDQLDDIAQQIHRCERQGKSLQPHLRRAKDAMASGRLTSSIDGVSAHTYKYSQEVAERYLKKEFDMVVKGAVHTARVSVATGKLVAKVGGKMLPLVDVGSGVYIVVDASIQYRAGTMDTDIYCAKLAVGGITAVAGTVGMALLLFPEPTGVTKVVGICVVVAGAGVAAVDFALDYIQERRIAERKAVLDKLDHQTKHTAVQKLILRDLAPTSAI